MSETFKQEMPPVGGYRPLNFERTFPKKFVSWKALLLANLISPLIWLYFYRKDKRLRFVRELETRNHSIAIEPCLQAENDRAYMRQLRINRDEEAELMKNVPGWEVGTYYGDKVYRTVPEEDLINVDVNEFYAHTRFAYLTEFIHADLRR